MEASITIITDNLINLANVLYLASYFVRDMLRLRIFTVVAASLLIVVFYSQPQPMMAAIYWNFFFIALNIFWVHRILDARKRAARRAELAPLIDSGY